GNMTRDRDRVEGDEDAATGEAPRSGELNRPAAPVTRIDAEGLAAHRDTPPAHETFTFVSDVDLTAPDGTVAFGAGSPPPPAFENDTRASSAPFVLPDEAAPPKKPTAPVAPSSDTNHVVAETTQVIANASPQTEADAARRYEVPQQATLPIEQVAQPPLSQSNISYSEA